MCGIAGVHCSMLEPLGTRDLGGNLHRELSEKVSRMAEPLKHRGPDASGVYVDCPVALSHRRLSIIDLEGGAQPMVSTDKSLAVSYNGEIFNFIELRNELKKKGCIFKTHSDTEVILHLYSVYGINFVNKLNGQFAIALWDREQQSLYLIRDRVGICPLYYTRQNKQILFASEIKSLLVVMDGPSKLNLQAIDQVFTFWAPLSPNTVFEGIFEVPPGEIAHIKGESFSLFKYWDYDFPETEHDFDHRPTAPLLEELNCLLHDATKIRLRSDVPVGTYLSGGLDSSLITSLVREHSPTDLQAYSLGFTDLAMDESKYQEQVIKHLNIGHNLLQINGTAICNNFIETLWHTETPILRTAPVPMGLLSPYVSEQGIKVILTGEGADEVFGGYDLFKEAKVRQFWAKYPHSELRPLLLKKLYPYLNLPTGKSGAYLRQFFGVGLEEPDSYWHSHLPRWQSTSKAKCFFDKHMPCSNIADPDSFTDINLPEAFKNWNWLNRAQYLEYKTLLPSYLLCSQGDRMLSKGSVEGRFPFLDHRVIEFAAKLPGKHKIKGLNEKYLLKSLASGTLPASIVARYKQPYRAPDVSVFCEQGFPRVFQQLLSEACIRDSGYFDSGKVSMLCKKISKGRSVSHGDSQAAVGILSTQIIHELFVNKTSLGSLST